jgi:hypothetical protein
MCINFYQQPCNHPYGNLMYCLEKGGPKRRHGGAPKPWVRPHPGWRLPTLPSRGRLLDGPRPHLVGLAPRIHRYVGLLLISWLRYALRFAWLCILTCISHLCPAKLINTKTCGTCELKPLILSFGIHICFLFKCWW